MRRLLQNFATVLAIVSLAGTLNGATIDIALNASDPAANSAALQSAIAHASYGDTVRVPAGSFPLDSAIQLRTGVNVVGIATDRSILTASFNQLQPMMAGRGLSKVGLHGFTLNGNGNKNVTQGIQLEKSDTLIIHDVTILNLPGSDRSDAPLGPHAIDCTSAVSKSAFDSITCKSIGVGRTWGGGIRLSWGSSGNLIAHCVVADTGRGGIFCNDGSTDNVIVGNTVSGSGGVGLGIEVQNCDRSLIEQNTIDHWLSVDNSSNSAVRRNQVSASDHTYKLCGIEVVDSHDVVVTDNAVTSGARIGLSISGPNPKTRMLFANNLFESATTWGAQIQGDAGGVSNLYFQSNRFIKTRTGPQPLYSDQGHGVRFNGNCHAIVFKENEIAHNMGVGVQVTGDNVAQLSFYGNSVLDNDGSTLDSDPIPHVTWSGNHVLPAGSAKLWEDANENVAENSGTLQLNNSNVPVDGAVECGSTFGSGFTPVAWLWDFGDGLPVTSVSARHAYAQPGTYHITLIAWDAGGRAGRANATITVNQTATPSDRD